MGSFLELEDIEKAAERNPDRFFILPRAIRTNFQVGASVKLHFLLDNRTTDDPRAERMWVTITQTWTPVRSYKGILDNHPSYISDLHLGDEIVFEPRHIAQKILAANDPKNVDCFEQKALVSRRCLDQNHLIRFVYREPRMHPEDSGWRMMAGDETEAYRDDPNNILRPDIGWLLDRDPSLLTPLKEGKGAFERESIVSEWLKVADWSPPD